MPGNTRVNKSGCWLLARVPITRGHRGPTSSYATLVPCAIAQLSRAAATSTANFVGTRGARAVNRRRNGLVAVFGVIGIFRFHSLAVKLGEELAQARDHGCRDPGHAAQFFVRSCLDGVQGIIGCKQGFFCFWTHAWDRV